MSQLITAVVKFWSNRQWTDLPTSFTYEFKEEITLPFPSLFHLHNGINTITKKNVSIFMFQKKKSEDTCSPDTNTFAAHLEYARNALKYSRTLLHPYILRVYEAVEVTSGIYIVTEAVTPLCLSCWLPDFSWGVYRLTSTLQFLHETCKVAHNLISPYAVYVTNDTAQWCLAHFDCVDPIEDTNLSSKYQNHPLYASQISVSVPGCQNTVIDRWRLGHIIQWACHSKKDPHVMTARSYCDFKSVSFKTSSALCDLYKELCKGVTSHRRSTKTLKNILDNTSLYFNTQLVSVMLFFDQFSLKNDIEKKEFFESLPKILDTIPCDCQFLLLLPQIIKLIQTSNQIETLALCILYIGENIKTAYQGDIQIKIFSSSVSPILLVLFHKTNRALRYLLLKNLELYYQYFETEQIEDIFKPVCLGLSDSTISLRIATLNALTILLPKVTSTKLIDEAVQQIFHLSCKDTEVTSRFQALQCLRSLYTASILSRQTPNFFQSLIQSTQDENEDCRQMALDILSLSLDDELNHLDYIVLMKQVAPSFCICSTDKNTIVQATAFSALEKLILKVKQFVPPLQCNQLDDQKTAEISSVLPIAHLDDESSVYSHLQREETNSLNPNPPTSLPNLSRIVLSSQNTFIENDDYQSDVTYTTHSSLSFHNYDQFSTPDNHSIITQKSGKNVHGSPSSTTFRKNLSNPTTSTTKFQISSDISKKDSETCFENIKASGLSFWDDFDLNQTNNTVKASGNNIDAIKKILASRQKNIV